MKAVTHLFPTLRSCFRPEPLWAGREIVSLLGDKSPADVLLMVQAIYRRSLLPAWNQPFRPGTETARRRILGDPGAWTPDSAFFACVIYALGEPEPTDRNMACGYMESADHDHFRKGYGWLRENDPEGLDDWMYRREALADMADQ